MKVTEIFITVAVGRATAGFLHNELAYNIIIKLTQRTSSSYFSLVHLVKANSVGSWANLLISILLLIPYLHFLMQSIIKTLALCYRQIDTDTIIITTVGGLRVIPDKLKTNNLFEEVALKPVI